MGKKMITDRQLSKLIESAKQEAKKELLEKMEIYFKHNGCDWAEFEEFKKLNKQ